MQKYSPISNDEPNMREDSERGTFYWCADVDARIAELEHQLDIRKAAVEAQFGLIARVKDLEKSAERYRKLRLLNPQQHRELWERNIREGVPFDTLVDGLGNATAHETVRERHNPLREPVEHCSVCGEPGCPDHM